MKERTRGQRAGLTRAAVLNAANQLLAEGGSAQLSMRALASRLQVAPNALYSHVRGKDELIDALLDETLAAVELPEASDARSTLGTIMTSTYDVLIAQRALVPAYLARQGARGPRAAGLGEAMRDALLAAGLDDATTGQAMHALIVSTIGYAAYDVQADDPDAARTGFLNGLGWLLDGILGEGVTTPSERRRRAPR